MDRFRHDNTEGYDSEDLATLNVAWDSLGESAPLDETDYAIGCEHAAAITAPSSCCSTSTRASAATCAGCSGLTSQADGPLRVQP